MEQAAANRKQTAEMSEFQEWLILFPLIFSQFPHLHPPTSHTAPFPRHYQPAQDPNMPNADPGWSQLAGLAGQTLRLPRHL